MEPSLSPSRLAAGQVAFHGDCQATARVSESRIGKGRSKHDGAAGPCSRCAGILATPGRRLRRYHSGEFAGRRVTVRSFLRACLAVVVIALVAAGILHYVVQEPVSVAFSTSAVRL